MFDRDLTTVDLFTFDLVLIIKIIYGTFKVVSLDLD